MKAEKAIDLIESKAISKVESKASAMQDELLNQIKSDSLCKAELEKIRKAKASLTDRCGVICQRAVGRKFDLEFSRDGELSFVSRYGCDSPCGHICDQEIHKIRSMCFEARLALVTGDAAEVIRKLVHSLGVDR